MADPINGELLIDIDERFMSARINISAPRNGGKPVKYDSVINELKLRGVRKFVDEDAIRNIFETEAFDRSVLIARGVEPVDGTNGSLKYLFDTTSAPEIKEDEYGNVDFHDLGTITNIEEGTPIADIIHETPGTPGMDIRGIEIHQTPGRAVNLPLGNGVTISEDGDHLIAAISGNLRWVNSHFVVDKDVVVSSDIDASVGNLDFIGDIIIKGNVNEGYVIKADGNITVFGNITGAVIECGGNLTARLGIVSSEVTVDGSISANFCENSNITVRGHLDAQNFVGCTVFCGGKLTAKGGKATIVGGKYTCLSDIEANYIGADTYIRTLITLGNVAVLVEERIDLEKRIKEYENQVNQLTLACDFLQKQKKAGPLTPEREELLSTSIRAKFAHLKSIQEMHQRLEAIELEIQSNNNLKIHVRRAIFPGVTVRINNSQYVVSRRFDMCTVTMDENREIVIHC